jgi:hypothetical protein
MLKIISFILLILFFSFNPLFSSGGFGGGISQIPQGQDREKYHLGKAVYNKELEFPATVNDKEVDQLDRLEFLQGSLPNTEKKRVNLLDLAGKLTKEQIDALEYFISIRFNVKINKK